MQKEYSAERRAEEYICTNDDHANFFYMFVTLPFNKEGGWCAIKPFQRPCGEHYIFKRVLKIPLFGLFTAYSESTKL